MDQKGEIEKKAKLDTEGGKLHQVTNILIYTETSKDKLVSGKQNLDANHFITMYY